MPYNGNMNTTVTHTIETRFIKDGLVVHENDLGYDFIEGTLRRLRGHHGAGGWTTESRTVTRTTETTDWK